MSIDYVRNKTSTCNNNRRCKLLSVMEINTKLKLGVSVLIPTLVN